jgi:hypothetical protein
VLGGIFMPPLLETHEATVIEFYDKFGDMNALLFRQFSDDMWALVTKLDEDWPAALVRLGYLQPPGSIIDLARSNTE